MISTTDTKGSLRTKQEFVPVFFEIKEETKETLRKATVELDQVLQYYCLGETREEVENNRDKLESFKKLFSVEVDFVEQDQLQQLKDSIQECKQLFEKIRKITNEKLRALGFLGIEEHLQFCEKLRAKKMPEALAMAYKAEERVKKSLPPWTFDVLNDWDKHKNSSERNQMHDQIIEKILSTVPTFVPLDPGEQRYSYYAGATAAGKTSTQEIQIVKSKPIVADVDEIRPLLFTALKEAGNPLFQDEAYNFGKYNPIDQAMIRALNPEAKVIMQKLIDRCLTEGRSVEGHGSIKSSRKMADESKKARKNNCQYEVTYVVTDLEVCWMRNLNRPRSVTAQKMLSSAETYLLIEKYLNPSSIHDSKDIPDKIIVMDNSGKVSRSILEAVRFGHKFIITEGENNLQYLSDFIRNSAIIGSHY